MNDAVRSNRRCDPGLLRTVVALKIVALSKHRFFTLQQAMCDADMAEMESLLDDIDMLLDYNELAGLLSPDIVASMILEQQGEELAVDGGGDGDGAATSLPAARQPWATAAGRGPQQGEPLRGPHLGGRKAGLPRR